MLTYHVEIILYSQTYLSCYVRDYQPIETTYSLHSKNVIYFTC